MSWMQKLHETYNNCQASVGYSGEEGVRPLLPICHITTQAHIEIVISKDGNFRRARVITDKRDMTTIIPCTEGSASRAGSKPECHPLCDKLQYVAGDFSKHGGSVTSGFAKKPEEPHKKYTEILTQWCQSEFVHPKAEAVLSYVKKGTVIKDLIEHQILFVGSDDKFLAKSEVKREKNTTDIFSVIDPQDGAFIRWVVESLGVLETKVWKDKTLWDSWKNYYLSTKEKEPLCFVTGEDAILTSNHPKYIRREGDGAKLISANDTSGFTYRGRFLTDIQACNVGLEVSQKSHYALSWLISRQGYRKGDLAIVAWATSGASIPKPTDDPLSIIGVSDLPTDAPLTADTVQIVAVKLKKKIAGYGKEIGNTTDIVVMGLDSATPGRLAITYYRELKGSDFLQRINDWHESCAWIHYYGSIDVQDEKGGKTKKYIPFIGAPAPSDIAEAAYATNRDGKFQLDEKLRKATIARILPCIIDGQQIPRDIVESAIRRASNRIALEDWQWNKTLTITCALYKKYKEKENYSMALDENRTTRDYLYGRLLAIAERLEEVALYKAKEKRATNAARYMQQFSQRPFRTWNQIHSALTPYVVRLGGAGYYKNLIAEVNGLFVNPEDYTSDKPLTGEYLLGYYCQRQKLLERTKHDVPSQKTEDNDESTEE